MDSLKYFRICLRVFQRYSVLEIIETGEANKGKETKIKIKIKTKIIIKYKVRSQ